jgi:YD repeat-containing protein
MKNIVNGQVEQHTDYAYDTLNETIQMVQDGNVIDYLYDDSGHLTSIKYPDGEKTNEIEYVYDTLGRLDSINMNIWSGETKEVSYKANKYFYTPSNKIDYVYNYRKFDTGGTDYTMVDYSYNSAGMLEGIKYLDNGTVRKEEYNVIHDKRGYITDETLYTNYDAEKTIQKSYVYDDIGRLQIANNITDSKTTTYTYDDVGNRDTMTDSTGSYKYHYSQFNALLSVDKDGSQQSSFQYDLNGNQIKEIAKRDVEGVTKNITTDYTYDWMDRLSTVTISDG